MKKSYINLHHTSIYAKNDSDEQFDIINEAHRKRWEGKTKSSYGFYGGYHYLIERNGVVQSFRDDYEIGAHNRSSWMNYRAIGIAFSGNMSVQHLTEEQIKASVILIRKLQSAYNISSKNIKPHRYYRSTQCPGNNLPDDLWNYLLDQNDKIEFANVPSIIRWHKKNKIIEQWNNPPTEQEMKMGWIAYKLGKAIVQGDLKKEDFNL
jgi:hypothetical protein